MLLGDFGEGLALVLVVVNQPVPFLVVIHNVRARSEGVTAAASQLLLRVSLTSHKHKKRDSGY